MANTFKKVLDRMMWVSSTPAPNAHAAARCVTSDLRNNILRNPFIYYLESNTSLQRYNIVTKAWNLVGSPALSGTFGAGAAMTFAPSLSLVGTIAAGATTTSVVISTAFPASVGVNMLASRGGSGDYGYKLRIIDTTAGKTEERWIVGNTGGTTPTITVETAFTFTPASGARYEILGGKVFMLSAGTVAGTWRSLEVATNFFSAALTTTNLPATISTDSTLVTLDEQYVPYNHSPGEGMVLGAYTYDSTSVLKALTATGSAAGTLTGQATLGDAVVAANEYRNFQIRIVEDTTTPASVGQRRIIASHTAGPSAVYTLGTNWTTTPSASAKFVIELPNLIILRTSATSTLYTYNYGDATVNNGTNNITSGSWSTTYFAGTVPAAHASGAFWVPSFGIQPDPARNARHSFLYFFRGNNTTTVDLFDIAGNIVGAWSAGIVIDGGVTMTATPSAAYSPFGNEGRMCYINSYVASAVNQQFRFDVKNRVLSPYVATDEIQVGTATLGNRLAAVVALDGTDEYDVVFLMSHLAARTQELIPLV